MYVCGPLKFKVVFVTKLFRELLWSFLNFITSKSSKLSFTLNCVITRAYSLKMISNCLVLLPRCVTNLKPLHVNRNHSQTCQAHNRDLINILLTLSSQSLLWVTDPRFFSSIYGSCTQKKLVRSFTVWTSYPVSKRYLIFNLALLY